MSQFLLDVLVGIFLVLLVAWLVVIIPFVRDIVGRKGGNGDA